MQDCFDRGQDVVFTPSGTSMTPMLNGKDDTVTLSAKPQRLQKYDVALYLRNKTGQIVLHRMVGFDKDGGYVFSGDGQYDYEYGVGDDDVLAVLTSYTHDGRQRDISGFSYRFYVFRMMLRKQLRIVAAKLYHLIKKS